MVPDIFFLVNIRRRKHMQTHTQTHTRTHKHTHTHTHTHYFRLQYKNGEMQTNNTFQLSLSSYRFDLFGNKYFDKQI